MRRGELLRTAPTQAITRLRDVSAWIESYRSFWPANLISLKRHLEGRKEPTR